MPCYKFIGIRASWPFGGAEVLWRSTTAVTPLECTDTKNGPASPLECTDTKSLDLKSFRIHCYKKGGWGRLRLCRGKASKHGPRAPERELRLQPRGGTLPRLI